MIWMLSIEHKCESLIFHIGIMNEMNNDIVLSRSVFILRWVSNFTFSAKCSHVRRSHMKLKDKIYRFQHPTSLFRLLLNHH